MMGVIFCQIMNKIVESLLLATILLAFRTSAKTLIQLREEMIDIIDYIYEKGIHTNPPIGLAITALKTGIINHQLAQCRLTYPAGLPMRWYLPFSEEDHAFSDLKSLMERLSTSNQTEYNLLQWGSIRYNKNGQVRNKSDNAVYLYQIPNIINGIFLRTMNRSNDQKEYNILYSDFEGDYFVASHKIKDEKIVAPKVAVLFNNLTTLRNVFNAWIPKQVGSLFITYTAEKGIQYVDLYGVPVVGKDEVQQNYSVFVCVHDPVRQYCFSRGKIKDCDIEYDSCVQCLPNLGMRNCQLGMNTIFFNLLSIFT
ncbi:hypothetical protein TTRE_0000902801 [Trichuris trichiura]|uniref:Uncharacterized protein n=1 Tax=Trichuris trichiura TaxID=36087 RepID=A0A077ZLP6_TRITR|nr:hypothetical protein TTRE_0000902801 [Trichuris trichiura]